MVPNPGLQIADAAAKAKALVESWGAVSSSLMIWDYVINFKHLLLPYPNYDVQADNHVLYLENNVRAVFHQGSREHDNEMARLRGTISYEVACGFGMRLEKVYV